MAILIHNITGSSLWRTHCVWCTLVSVSLFREHSARKATKKTCYTPWRISLITFLKSDREISAARCLTMEGLEVFYTELEENTRTFYPGEAVYGEVLLKTSEEMRFKELRLHCTGEASVSWPESSGCYSRYHHNREQYFDTAASITDRGQLQCRSFSSLLISRAFRAQRVWCAVIGSNTHTQVKWIFP